MKSALTSGRGIRAGWALALAMALGACGESVIGGDAMPDSPGADRAVIQDTATQPDIVMASDVTPSEDASMSEIATEDVASSDGAREDTAPLADATTEAATSLDSSMRDATVDATRDAAADASADALTDAAIDTARDVSMDSSSDASMDAAPDAGTCALQGDWVTTLPMMAGMLAFRFDAAGTWQGAMDGASLGTPAAIPVGNYAVSGRTIVLTNDPGMSGCMMSDRGEYTVSYDPSCNTMTWVLVRDTCMGRASALNNATFRRFVRDGGSVDAGADADAAPDASACAMRGSWDSMFAMGGGMAVFRFSAGTTWEAALTRANLAAGMTIPLGNYSESAARIVLTADPGGASGCVMSDRGEYTISYSSACSRATWTVVSDTCTTRRDALNGGTFVRF
ncbi:MAG: hypothetical protein Q8Q09_05500 [Deltaproteobacteria bacterium]|nr:hypothetical protein [Deltaproteobacteria bacterium]